MEASQSFGGEVEFTGGQGVEGFGAAFGALCFGVEAADFLDFVVEQDDADGLEFGGWEDVGLSAADGEFTGGADLFDAGVSAECEAGGEGGEVDFSAELQVEGSGGDEGGGREGSEGGGCGGDCEAGGVVEEFGEGVCAGADDFGGGREGVVGQGFPVGQQADGELGVEEGNFLGEVRGGKGVAGEEERGLAHAARKAGDCECLAGAAKSGYTPRPLRREGKQ